MLPHHPASKQARLREGRPREPISSSFFQFLAVNRDTETGCSSRRPHFSLPAASSECQYIFIHLSSTSALLSAPECYLHSETHLNRAKAAEIPIAMPKRESSAEAPETVDDNAVTKKSFLTRWIRCLDLFSGEP